jgi:hypothetical protein
MLTLIIIVVICALFGIATYAVLFQVGVLPGSEQPRGSERLPDQFDGGPTPLRRYGEPRTSPGVTAYLRGLPQGCLIAVLAAAALWFISWGIVLILALRILSSPY